MLTSYVLSLAGAAPAFFSLAAASCLESPNWWVVQMRGTSRWKLQVNPENDPVMALSGTDHDKV